MSTTPRALRASQPLGLLGGARIRNDVAGHQWLAGDHPASVGQLCQLRAAHGALTSQLLAQEGHRMLAQAQPHRVVVLDQKAIRVRRGPSQVAFARRYGFSPDAVRDWGQGRWRPEQAARTLLLVIDKGPEAVEGVLATA
ncbi:helix-turn-helix domain-containing protein [Rhizosaccharibacter radicis]|uniref:Transcriptional regulator n=1 Tax=Rhizosaccharibacter radicis TaxID=2782605 RepID=A0ABT1VZ85_9PROT|nr:hypothetical protein [Acetobacteraceae bacterium KSS12]